MTRTRKWDVVASFIGVVIAFAALMLAITCQRALSQEPAKDSSGITQEHPVFNQEPQKPVLTEVEKLKLVNTYQAAVIAQVDAQTAQARLAKARDAYMTLVGKLRDDHKWDAATTFEINSETGEVLVHLPPADAKKPEVKGQKQ